MLNLSSVFRPDRGRSRQRLLDSMKRPDICLLAELCHLPDQADLLLEEIEQTIQEAKLDILLAQGRKHRLQDNVTAAQTQIEKIVRGKIRPHLIKIVSIAVLVCLLTKHFVNISVFGLATAVGQRSRLFSARREQKETAEKDACSCCQARAAQCGGSHARRLGPPACAVTTVFP